MSEWRANLIEDDAGLARVLREARTVAVLGAKAQTWAPAHFSVLEVSAMKGRPLEVTL